MGFAAAERVKESSPSFEAGGGGDVAVIQVGGCILYLSRMILSIE